MAGRTLRCLIFLGMVLAGWARTGHAVVPAGFSDDPLITSVGSPTALAFTPDGRMLITTQPGSLWVWHGTLLPTPALTFPASSICNNAERGLLGVAVDPGFATNLRIYLFYTFKKPDTSCVNRVSRFTFFAAAGQQDQLDPASELVLIDNMPSPGGFHNAGDLHVGKDGYLYISIGDGGSFSRDQHVLGGKILRITLDGGIPPTNPFQGAGTARCNVTGMTTPGNKCQETFAWGLRNPFRFAMDPNTAGTNTRFFINDVGQITWEEIDEGQAGADYGWICREGAHTFSTTGPCSPAPPGMVDPIFEYPHDAAAPGTGVNNCNAITGGAFVPNGLWPGFDGSYLFVDLICGGLFKLTQAGGTWSAATFGTGLFSSIHLTFGPWGTTRALYYATYTGGGQVRRISFRIPRPAGPLDYHTVPPCRVADTRLAFGMQGGPALAAGATRTFQAAGLCGVPFTASAVALNVTVVSPSTGGFLRIDPGDEPASSTSTVNFTAGAVRSNNAVSFLGTAGDVAVIASIPSGTAHVVIDVTGYFQ